MNCDWQAPCWQWIKIWLCPIFLNLFGVRALHVTIKSIQRQGPYIPMFPWNEWFCPPGSGRDLGQREISVCLKDMSAFRQVQTRFWEASTQMCIFGELDPGWNNEDLMSFHLPPHFSIVTVTSGILTLIFFFFFARTVWLLSPKFNLFFASPSPANWQKVYLRQM